MDGTRRTDTLTGFDTNCLRVLGCIAIYKPTIDDAFPSGIGVLYFIISIQQLPFQVDKSLYVCQASH